MDLRQLRYFIAIVEQGSFSQAASFLNIAQPALSLHVRNMERDLGTALLYRSPKGVAPTEAGEILLRNARIILNQMTIAEEEIRGHDSDPAGVVRVGLPGTISEILSVPLIVAAHRRYPSIQLRLAEAMSGFVAEWLTDARIDLALVYGQSEGQNLALLEVLSEELVFFCRRVDAAGLGLPPEGLALPFARLAEIPLIVPGQAHGLRILLNEAALARQSRLSVAIEVDSYSNIKELVRAGFGCSILPRNGIKRELAAGEMQCWSIEAPQIRRSAFLAHSEDRPMTNAVSAVHHLIQDVLRDLLATGTWAGATAAEGIVQGSTQGSAAPAR
ncbi:LysR substrate-binding domain-containing protein [Frigidibacter sp. MR17.24]|uniref:LysR substrate-binding domain-containing protein n=1 Tax=Frigidibacter sp. MR17.24 TaxID=3127345 RepID=UPI0030131349